MLFVTASRFIERAYKPRMPVVKLWGNRLMAAFVSWIIAERYYDVSCGFRAYSREAYLRLNLFGEFTYTQETFLNLASHGVSILEVPVAVRGLREAGRSHISANLFQYGYQTCKIILQAFRDHNPLRLFWFLSAACLVPAMGLGLFFIYHFFETGAFSPHKWAGFLSGFLIVVAMFFLLFGFILDMFGRMRHIQEEMLFNLRRVAPADSQDRDERRGVNRS